MRKRNPKTIAEIIAEETSKALNEKVLGSNDPTISQIIAEEARKMISEVAIIRGGIQYAKKYAPDNLKPHVDLLDRVKFIKSALMSKFERPGVKFRGAYMRKTNTESTIGPERTFDDTIFVDMEYLIPKLREQLTDLEEAHSRQLTEQQTLKYMQYMLGSLLIHELFHQVTSNFDKDYKNMQSYFHDMIDRSTNQYFGAGQSMDFESDYLSPLEISQAVGDPDNPDPMGANFGKNMIQSMNYVDESEARRAESEFLSNVATGEPSDRLVIGFVADSMSYNYDESWKDSYNLDDYKGLRTEKEPWK